MAHLPFVCTKSEVSTKVAFAEDIHSVPLKSGAFIHDNHFHGLAPGSDRNLIDSLKFVVQCDTVARDSRGDTSGIGEVYFWSGTEVEDSFA